MGPRRDLNPGLPGAQWPEGLAGRLGRRTRHSPSWPWVLRRAPSLALRALGPDARPNPALPRVVPPAAGPLLTLVTRAAKATRSAPPPRQPGSSSPPRHAPRGGAPAVGPRAAPGSRPVPGSPPVLGSRSDSGLSPCRVSGVPTSRRVGSAGAPARSQCREGRAQGGLAPPSPLARPPCSSPHEAREGFAS